MVKLSCPASADYTETEAKCSITAEDSGSESTGIASIEYRARLRDGAWLAWRLIGEGETFGFPAVATMDVQARLEDNAGRSSTDAARITIAPPPVDETGPPGDPESVESVSLPPPVTCQGQPATILGSPGDDRGPTAIVATAAADVMISGGGEDEVLGADDQDLVCEQPDSGSSPSVLEDAGSSNLGQTASSAAATGKPFGYHNGVEYFDLAEYGAADSARIYVHACPGFSDWAGYDEQFRRAYQHGLKVLLGVVWSRSCGGPASPPYDDQHLAWRTFVRDAVGRAVWYSQQSVWVEVWNEPNTGQHWGADPSPFWYAHAYWYAWGGVQDAEAAWGPGFNFPVMTAGGGRPEGDCPGNYQTEPDTTKKYMCVRWFLGGVRETLSGWGAVHMVEMAGAHIYPYPWAINRHTRTEYSDEVGRQFNDVRVNFPSITTPTFITEAGIRSDAPLDERAQCNRLIDIYNGWMPSSVTAGLIVYRLVDNYDERQAPQQFFQMGTTRSPSSPKESYWWLRALHYGWRTDRDCTS